MELNPTHFVNEGIFCFFMGNIKIQEAWEHKT